jgi:exopolysaccharide biosynthesis predicted pyruvyltransferase EpsI
MRNNLYRFYLFLKLQYKILFSFKRKVFILGAPFYGNLGDQAQYMVAKDWLNENFPKYEIIRIEYLIDIMGIYSSYSFFFKNSFTSCITVCLLKFRVNENDIFVGHSGYFFDDHHPGWKTFADILHFFPNNKFFILPQTVLFKSRYFIQQATRAFNNHPNLLLFCRDKTSFSRAKELFPTIKLKLQPDIVTSLIGQQKFKFNRNGLLFCIRNDGENYYSRTEINSLKNRFKEQSIKTNEFDTTLNKTFYEVDKNRRILIKNMIEQIAHYKVVITDKYHGVIFSAIASTPVIVLASADHKLRSGYEWFVEGNFNDSVLWASSLDQAYTLALKLHNREEDTINSSYFKEKYFDNLYDIINESISL